MSTCNCTLAIRPPLTRHPGPWTYEGRMPSSTGQPCRLKINSAERSRTRGPYASRTFTMVEGHKNAWGICRITASCFEGPRSTTQCQSSLTKACCNHLPVRVLPKLEMAGLDKTQCGVFRVVHVLFSGSHHQTKLQSLQSTSQGTLCLPKAFERQRTNKIDKAVFPICAS